MFKTGRQYLGNSVQSSRRKYLHTKTKRQHEWSQTSGRKYDEI